MAVTLTTTLTRNNGERPPDRPADLQGHFVMTRNVKTEETTKQKIQTELTITELAYTEESITEGKTMNKKDDNIDV